MQRWISVRATPRGTTVTVTLREDNTSVSVTEKTFGPELRGSAMSAQSRAEKMLAKIKEFPHV